MFYYKIYIVYRDFITTLIIGVSLLYCVHRDCYGLSPLKTIYKDFVHFHFHALMISR